MRSAESRRSRRRRDPSVSPARLALTKIVRFIILDIIQFIESRPGSEQINILKTKDFLDVPFGIDIAIK